MSSGLTPNQKSHLSYNQIQSNKATTNINLEGFEEAFDERLPLSKGQIWIDSDRIPTTNPLKSDAIADGTTYSDSGDLIITKLHQRELSYVLGSEHSFYDSGLDVYDCIPPNQFGT